MVVQYQRSTEYGRHLENGRHFARLLRRRRRRAHAHTSNTASHNNHEKINSCVSLAFRPHDEYGAPLSVPSGRRSSAIKSSNLGYTMSLVQEELL